MNERAYWLDTVLTQQERVAVPESVDVAIVGGGFTGLSAARALASRGARVAVIEMHHVGWGASSRNGGMVLTGLKVPASALAANFGVERARRLFDASLASIDCVERIAKEEAIDCDFVRCGHAEVACKRRHFDAMRKEAEALLMTYAHLVDVVERRDITRVVASDAYYGAVVDPTSAGINPARFAVGLANAAKRRGAIVIEEALASAVQRTSKNANAGFTVLTTHGATHAQHVLIATGAYTVAPRAIRRRVIAVGSFVIATEPLDEQTAKTLIPGGRMIFDSNNFLHYYRLTPDRRLLFGGRAAFFPANDRTIRDSAEILRRGMVGAFPQLAQTKVEYAWGGSIDFAFDMLPHAGVQNGLHYALGYAGHGVAMATYLGERVAAAILGDMKIEDALPTGPLPTPPPGLSGDTPWFLPIAGAWYRLLDWAS